MSEAWFEKVNPRFGHNTGIVILLGIACSAGIYLKAQELGNKEILLNIRFDDKLFFDVMLPLIVFPSGYNMRRKMFFANIGTIMKFGLVGTIFCFCIYTVCLWGVVQADLIT